MHQLKNKTKLYALLADGANVIIPNNRLSAALLHQYFIYCSSQTLEKPRCQPYTTVITNAYKHLKSLHFADDHPILLNDAQCHYLWRKILNSEPNITFSEGLSMALLTK